MPNLIRDGVNTALKEHRRREPWRITPGAAKQTITDNYQQPRNRLSDRIGFGQRTPSATLLHINITTRRAQLDRERSTIMQTNSGSVYSWKPGTEAAVGLSLWRLLFSGNIESRAALLKLKTSRMKVSSGIQGFTESEGQSLFNPLNLNRWKR
jgi:hypothetical protein